MNTELSKKISQLRPSATLEFQALVNKLKSEGKKVLNLGGGEGDAPSPGFVVEACVKALRDGKTKYVPAEGIPALRSAIADYYSKKHITHANVIVSCGAKFACYSTLLSICSEGDEVLIPSPFWVSYPAMTSIVGGVPKFLRTSMEESFKVTPKLLEENLSKKTRVLILNNPHNPTGTVYAREELKALLEIAVKNNIYVICDEIYDRLVYADNFCSTTEFEWAKDNLVTFSGFSKSFSMTGWRIGYIISSKEIINGIKKVIGQTISNVTSFAQYGALSIFNEPGLAKEYLQDWKQTLEKRKVFATQSLRAIEGLEFLEPKGAFYLFVNVAKLGLNGEEFAKLLLQKTGVAVLPGIAFGEKDFVRMNFAVNDSTLQSATKEIASAIKNI